MMCFPTIHHHFPTRASFIRCEVCGRTGKDPYHWSRGSEWEAAAKALRLTWEERECAGDPARAL